MGSRLSHGCLAIWTMVGCASTERPLASAPSRAEPLKAEPLRFDSPVQVTVGDPAEPVSSVVPEQLSRRQDAEGSTVGTIACGHTRCRAGTEVCTETSPSKWTCLPSESTSSGYYACDDASDCAAPLSCCVSFASAEEIFACLPSEDCAALACAEPDGMECPQGLRCNGNVCVADSRATCAEGKQCPKEAPNCAWGSAPVCVEGGVAGDGEPGSPFSGLYECTKPSDCGGSHECCTSMLYAERATYCFHQCDPSNSARLCTQDADCTDRAGLWCGEDVECRRAVRCAPVNDAVASVLPPWMRTCQLLDH